MNDNDIFVYDTLPKEIPQLEVKTFQLVPPLKETFTLTAPEFDFTNPPVNPNEFASTLVETAKKVKTFGLSAIQCGFNYRVFVMGTVDGYVAFFNPKIISTEGETHMKESCVSFPLLLLAITRPKSIKVEYQDFNGITHQSEYHGLTARIFQHELDHLNGIVYTDRVKPLALKSGMKKVEKIYRKQFDPRVLQQLINNGNQKTNT